MFVLLVLHPLLKQFEKLAHEHKVSLLRFSVNIPDISEEQNIRAWVLRVWAGELVNPKRVFRE